MAAMAELEMIKRDFEELFDGVLPPAETEGDFCEPGGFTDMERLAVAQAFMNVVGDMTSTKGCCNLRGRVNEQMVELYEETGAKSFDVRLRGEKVGTYSLTVSRPTESKTAPLFSVTDKGAFSSWRDFRAVAYHYAMEHMQEVADWHFGKTGEVPGGCEVTEVVYPGNPGGEVTRSTLRVDSEAVASVLGAELPGAARMLLEGGQDD